MCPSETSEEPDEVDDDNDDDDACGGCCSTFGSLSAAETVSLSAAAES